MRIGPATNLTKEPFPSLRIGRSDSRALNYDGHVEKSEIGTEARKLGHAVVPNRTLVVPSLGCLVALPEVDAAKLLIFGDDEILAYQTGCDFVGGNSFGHSCFDFSAVQARRQGNLYQNRDRASGSRPIDWTVCDNGDVEVGDIGMELGVLWHDRTPDWV